MFSWWPKRSDSKRDAAREAYLKRLREVLEDCTRPRRAGSSSQVAKLEPNPAEVAK